jgi:hypothetical protein
MISERIPSKANLTWQKNLCKPKTNPRKMTADKPQTFLHKGKTEPALAEIKKPS